MFNRPTRQGQNKHVHWSPRSSESTVSWSSPDADSRNLHSPQIKPTKCGDADVECRFTPVQFAIPGVIMMAVPVVSTLHPVLAYFVFNWDVRAAQFPNFLPEAARKEPAFPSLPFPMPVTIWFENPLSLSPCVINPLEHNGKPVPINVGRVLACISRELYTPIHSTAPYAGHVLLPAVREATAGRPYDPEPSRKKRVARNVDLYPVARSRYHAPLFFWGIELQHCGGGAVRLVARFGHKALKA